MRIECESALSVFIELETLCPRVCDEADDYADCEPFCCAEGQEERNPDVCGTEECSTYLLSLTDDIVLEAATTLLSTCGYDIDVEGPEDYLGYM